MLFLIAILIAAGFSWLCAKQLHEHPVSFYIGAVLVTVLMAAIGQSTLTFKETVILKGIVDLFNRGSIAAALWLVIAYTGAFPNGSAPIKHLMPARGELSIVAAIITLSHAVTWGVTYVQRLIKYSDAGQAPATDFIASCCICLLLMGIMLPLTVISFKAVRKKLQAKKWKKIQRFAYLFYVLIYAHVMVIFIPRLLNGRKGALLNVLIYSTLFLGYVILRLCKLYLKKSKTESHLIPNVVCIAVYTILMGSITGICVRLHDSKQPKLTATALVEPVTEETTAPTEPTPPQTEPETAPPTEAVTETTEPTEMTEETSGTTEPTEAAEETEAAASSEEAALQVEQQDEAKQQEQQPEPEPEPQYTYNNGTFSGHGTTPMDQDKDYEGYVDVRVTIENDVILRIEIAGWGDDPDYYWMAENEIPGRILSAQSPDIDAVCGATRSAEGIKEAVRNALDSARR